MSLVTLVTPFYNRKETLEYTIKSVFNQDYSDLEYIIVNDCSDEENRMFLCLMGEKYPTVKIIHLEENKGQSEALNIGWSESSGEYIGYLSDDDVLKPNAISELVKNLKVDPSIVMVYPDCEIINAHGDVLKNSMYSNFDRESIFYDFNCNVGVGALFKKEMYLECGGWDKSFRLIPDIDFWARVSAKGSCAFVPKVLASQRTHVSSGSLELFAPKYTQEFIDMINKYADTYVMHGIDRRLSLCAAYMMHLASSLLRFDVRNFVTAVKGITVNGGSISHFLMAIRIFLSKSRSIIYAKYKKAL